MTDNLNEGLQEVLQRYVADPADWRAVLAGEPLLGMAELDSLSVVNLVTELELIFDVRFDDDTLEQTLFNIHTLAAFVENASLGECCASRRD
ncbi:hypothetical protein [Holophaga foetida]|uniref:hypothetical protein n=1 Tax=Holophaga foetida TaxID=35839 RepID=UPI0002472628|nr:hypothetical protein [Holophaga foetida]